MTVTNTLYKQENGQLADADEINSDKSFILSQIIMGNLNYLANHTFATNPLNFIYDQFTSITYIDATSTCSVSLGCQIAFSGYVYDDYSDSVFDTNKWTGTATSGVGTSSEVAGTNINIASEGYVQYAIAAGVGVEASGTLDATGATTTANLKPAAGTDAECVVYVYAHLSLGSAVGGSKYVYAKLRDNLGNSVTLWSATNPSADTQATIDGTLRLVFRSGNNCDVYQNSNTISSTVSTAGLAGTNWFLRLECDGAASGAQPESAAMRFRKLRYANASVSVPAAQLLSTARTLDATSSIWCLYCAVTASGTYIFEQSVDNGANYTTVLNGVIGKTANTGTQGITRVTYPTGALAYMPKVQMYGYYYN